MGKAKSLRQRLSSYFQSPGALSPRTAQMVAAAESVEWIQVRNDVEALMLEYSLIKQHKPRFNVRLRDDKSYPFLVLTTSQAWPRAAIRRGRPQGRRGPGAASAAAGAPSAGTGAASAGTAAPSAGTEAASAGAGAASAANGAASAGNGAASARSGAAPSGKAQEQDRYYGPYAHAYAIRETLDLLLRTFPVRSCSDAKFGRHERLGKPCLMYHIERCAGPCAGLVGKEEYWRLVEELAAFLEGDSAPVVRELEAEMHKAAENLEFELAARLRDRLGAVKKAIEKQQMVTERAEDLDCFGLAEDELEAAVQVFYVRRGRVVGRRGFVVDKVEDLSRPQLLANVLEQHYSEPRNGVPPVVLVPSEVDEAGTLERWLSELRADSAAGRGLDASVEWWAASARRRPERSVDPAAGGAGRVRLHVPQRGEKKALLEMVTKNAAEELARQRLRRSQDHNARARALNALQDALGLPEAPLRIECYDMSHLQGTDYVGSMVVMEDGLPKPSEYKRFKVKTVPGNDDYAAMEEVLTRRLTAYLQERELPVAERKRHFSYPPQLLLVDGGKGQLGVAVRVLEELGLDGQVPVAALAKQFEEVYLPGASDPLRIPRGSEALYLLQRIRDEAHRFAVSYHRKLRGRKMRASELDGVPGLGPSRRKRLVAELGSIKAVRDASRETLAALSWLPEPVADALWHKLHGSSGDAVGLHVNGGVAGHGASGGVAGLGHGSRGAAAAPSPAAAPAGAAGP